jgi:hypothetical protein
VDVLSLSNCDYTGVSYRIAMASNDTGIFKGRGHGCQKKIAKTNAAADCKAKVLLGCNEAVGR